MPRQPWEEAGATRRVARALSLLVLVMVAVFLVAEGLPGPSAFRGPRLVHTLSFLALCAGLIVAWRSEGFGGSLTLGALLVFSLAEHRISGRFPNGWILPILALPGLLFVVSWWRLRPRERPETPI